MSFCLSSKPRFSPPARRKDEVGSALIYFLLVILCIVAALIYLPVLFSKFDVGAAKTRSANNLLQWGIALNLYLADNNDHFPEVGGEVPSTERELAWYNALPEYLSLDPLTARRPEDRPKPGMQSIWVDPLATPREAKLSKGDYFFSYAMNYWLHPLPGEKPYRIFNLTDPAGVIFLSTTAGPRPGLDPSSMVFRADAKRNTPAALAPVLFADGHVEWKSRSEVAPEGGGDKHLGYWLPFAEASDPDYSGILIPPLRRE